MIVSGMLVKLVDINFVVYLKPEFYSNFSLNLRQLFQKKKGAVFVNRK